MPQQEQKWKRAVAKLHSAYAAANPGMIPGAVSQALYRHALEWVISQPTPTSIPKSEKSVVVPPGVIF